MPELVAAMSRLSTETAFEVLARAAALAAEGRSVVNLGIGQPDFPTPEHIVEAAVKALRDGAHGYTPAPGIPALREAVAADLLARRGVEVSPERIVIMPGGKPTMFFTLLMFGAPGVEVLYPDPSFPIYRSMIDFTGATAVPIPLREETGFAFSAEEALARITPRTKLIIVNSPSNPTGGVTPRAEMDKLAAGIADRPDIALLSDEIYSRMLYDDARHESFLSHPELADRLILLDGWSKTYAMTGWRLGYSVWPEALTPHAIRLCVNCHSCVNAATQVAGIAALTGPQEPVDAMMAAFAERKRLIVDRLNALPGVSCVEPKGAFYAFPNVSGTGLDGRTLQHRLLEEAGVATVAGTSFGAAAGDFVRFSYANSLENIAEAMDRFERLLAG